MGWPVGVRAMKKYLPDEFINSQQDPLLGSESEQSDFPRERYRGVIHLHVYEALPEECRRSIEEFHVPVLKRGVPYAPGLHR